MAAKTVLAAGILVNLGILGYYKYFDFFLRIVNRLTGSEHEMRNIPLPIGISFLRRSSDFISDGFIPRSL